jgi:CelD/BcsL family acetyltransferase involved in cellulose biosynthesis
MEIYAFLAASNAWQIADFSQLRDGSLLRANPPQASSGLASVDFTLERCPYLPFPLAVIGEGESKGEARWRALLKQYSKKMRSHIGYYERKLKSLYEVDCGIIQDERKLDDAMTALFELHRRRWNKRWLPGVLGGKRVQRFHRRAAREFLIRGWLRLHYILLDGDYQALLYCFAYRDRTCYYQGGFEPTLAKLSLGSVLTAASIRRAIDEDRSELDFLRGDEPYKERWTQGQARLNSRRLMSRIGTPFLTTATLEFRIENLIEMRFKEFMHHVYSKEPKTRPSVAVQESEDNN